VCSDHDAGAAADGAVEAAAATIAAVRAAVQISRDTAASHVALGPGPGPEPLPVSDSATVSRRGLFTFAARGLRRTAAGGAAPARRSAAVLHRQAPPARARSRLLHDLAALAARSGAAPASLPAALPVANVVVASSCDGCGLCLRYCPHAALTPSREGRVDVDDALCTGCELCVETCPREALALEPAPFRPQKSTAAEGPESA
jgi:ferredoxin